MTGSPYTPPLFVVIQDAGAAVLAAIYNWSGTPITQVGLSAITRDIRVPKTGELIASDAITIASVIYDTWQTSALQWPYSDNGYNFRDVIPAAKLNKSRRLLVEHRFTPASGEVFKLQCLVDVAQSWSG